MTLLSISWAHHLERNGTPDNLPAKHSSNLGHCHHPDVWRDPIKFYSLIVPNHSKRLRECVHRTVLTVPRLQSVPRRITPFHLQRRSRSERPLQVSSQHIFFCEGVSRKAFCYTLLLQRMYVPCRSLYHVSIPTPFLQVIFSSMSVGLSDLSQDASI